uniref:Ig-like domain-containing protein n=1 Tax=Oryzias melastigma TaxID=30732 RepID=A0A3B3C8U3_ORYME
MKGVSEVTGYVGHDVTLPCSFIPGTKYSNVTQSQWEFLSPDGNKTLIMVSSKDHGECVHESHLKGRVDMEDQLLLIKNVELSDAGSYICTVSTFPLGILDVTTKLDVQDGNKTLIMVSSKQHGKTVHESHLKGRVDMEDQSLIIKNVELSDAGSYICTITSFPDGPSKKKTYLHVSFQETQRKKHELWLKFSL